MARRPNIETYTAVRATPDAVNIARVTALQARAARPMQGISAGQVVGYDRGDPAHSFTGPVAAANDPAAAMAGTITPAANIYQPQATYQDLAITNPQLAPLAAAQLARMGRTR